MDNLYLSNEFIIINEYNTHFFVVKKFPYSQFNINQDSFTILEYIQQHEGLPQDGEPVAEHIINFVHQLLEYGILTTDPKKRGQSLKKKMIEPDCKRVFVELTPQCNLHCRHCFNGSHPESMTDQLMSTGEVKDLIDQAHEMGVWQFDLTGGEIFLRDDLFEILSYLNQKGMMVKLFTNLTLLNENDIPKLRACNITKIVTSLDGASAGVHDEFRGVQGSFAKTVRNIRLLQEQGFDLNVNVMVGDHNFHEIDTLIDYLRFELKVAYNPDVIMPIGRGSDIGDAGKYAACLGYLNSIKRKEIPCDVHHMGEFECAPQTFCGVGRNFIFITAEGSYNLCQSMSYRQNPEFSFGNLRTDPLHDVWTQRMEPFRNLRCEKQDQCSAKEKCAGGCRSRVYAVENSLYSADTVYCKIYGCE